MDLREVERYRLSAIGCARGVREVERFMLSKELEGG